MKEPQNSSTRLLAVYLSVVVVFGAAIWFSVWFEKNQDRTKHYLTGETSNVTDNMMEVLVDGTSFTVYYDQNTKIIETLQPVIDQENLDRLGGELNPIFLQKRSHPGKLEVLQNTIKENSQSVKVTIKTREDISSSAGTLYAEEVNYEIQHNIVVPERKGQ